MPLLTYDRERRAWGVEPLRYLPNPIPSRENDRDTCVMTMSASASLSLSLYRAMWRATRTPQACHAKFAVPLTGLPDSIASLGRNIKPSGLRNQEGLQRLVREAWRAGAAARAESPAALDDAFTCLRAMGQLQGELEIQIEQRVAKADRVR